MTTGKSISCRKWVGLPKIETLKLTYKRQLLKFLKTAENSSLWLKIVEN